MLAALLVLAIGGPVDGNAARIPAIARGRFSVARPPSVPTDPRSEAAAAFATGEAAYRRGDYEMAADRFARAYALVPHPATLYNLGLAQSRSGDAVAAWRTFDRLSKEATTERERREAAAARDRLLPRVAIVRIEAPSGGSVCFDGDRVDLAGPRDVVVTEPGPHRLHAGGAVTRLDLSAGEVQTIDLEAILALARMQVPARAMVPLLVTTVIGSGAATGLGITAATIEDADTTRGLATGAAIASGIAFGTAVTALVLRLRGTRSRHTSKRSTRVDPCR